MAGVAVFALTFDPNRYKGEIERLAKEQTGARCASRAIIASGRASGRRSRGDVLEKGSTRISSFDSAHASVKLMPLLSGQYVVDRVSLSGFKARVVKARTAASISPTWRSRATRNRRRKAAKVKSAPIVFDIGGVSIERASR